MELLEKIKSFPLFSLIMVLTFLVSGTIMSGLLFLACCFVWPFSHYYYRQLSYYLIYPVWAQLVFLIDWWAPSEIILYMDEESQAKIGKEHAMVIMNHSYDIDFLVGWLVCERNAVLAASKVFAKRSLSYVPIVGWIWRMAETIFLDRNWQTDKSCIANQIAQISEYHNPVWLLLYPEGTRFTPNKHKASVEFAEKQGLPILKHLLIPRTKGFVLSMQAIKESGYKIRAIYDVTIACPSGIGINEPTLMNLIKGKPVTAHLRVFRIPMEDVPTEDEACTKWMHDDFARKDRLMSEFFKTGHYDGRHVILRRRPFTLVNQIFWTSLVLGAVLYYGVFHASTLSLCIISTLILCVSFALPYLANLTVSSKGSSYGKIEKNPKEVVHLKSS